MLCYIGKLIKGIIRREHRNGRHIEIRMIFGIFHHLLIGNHKTIFVVIPNGMTYHRFPDHRTQLAGIRMFVFNSRYDSLHMTDTDDNTAVIFNKRNLLSISDTERLIRDNIPVKIIKDRPMIVSILNPGRSKA